MGRHGRASTQLILMERELEIQMKESLEESKALREKFQHDLDCIREDSERRLVERNDHAKKQQAKWKEHALCMEREKAELVQQAELLQKELIGCTQDICLARERILLLEAEVQSVRSRPPQLIERADPGAAVEIMRLRDRANATKEQARRAHRAAAEAREAVGRESAINQGFQRDVDGARHRLLTVQASLAEVSEENVRLRRELEGERIKAVAGSRRLEDVVQRQDNALAEVRCDSAQLREQRDRLAQESAILGIKLHQSKKREVARRLFHGLGRVAHRSLATAWRALLMAGMSDIHSKKEARQKEEHVSEVACFETDLHRAETRCRDALRRVDRLLESRGTVASLVIKAYRRRQQGTMFAAAAAEEDSASAIVVAQRWCFWGWARVAQNGSAAVTRRERRVELEKEIIGVREMLSAAIEKTRGAESERNRHGARAEALADEIDERTKELEVARAAVNATQSMASCIRNRVGRLGAIRLKHTLEKNRRFRLSWAFAAWIRIVQSFPSFTPSPAVGENGTPLGRHKDGATACAKCGGTGQEVPEETERAQAQPDMPRAMSDCIPPQLPSVAGFGPSRVEKEVNTQDVGEEATVLAVPSAKKGRSTSKDPPTTILLSTVQVKDTIEDDADGTDTVIAKERDEILTRLTASGDHSAWLHQYNNPSSLAATSSTSSQAVREQSSIQDLDAPMDTSDSRMIDSPLPEKRCSPVSTILPSPSTCRRAQVEDITNVTCGNRDSSEAYVATTPVTGRGSICSAIPNSPRAVLALRAAVGQELYDLGERLLRCVEADHREIHGRLYHAISITRAEREQFRACLEDASRGSLKRTVLAFLEVQESCRAVAAERDRGDGANSRGGRHGEGGDDDAFSGAKTKKRNAWDTGERQHELSSLTTGPLSSPAEKARAARVLRDRLVSLLDDADEVWGWHRRPWEKKHQLGGIRKGTTTTNLSRSKRRTKAGMAAETSMKISVNANRRLHGGLSSERQPPSPAFSRRLRYLDSGAGPRTFWETVTGPRLVEASWAMNFEELEQQLWRLVMLVRCRDIEDRAHGGRREVLALNRRERLRRILDARIYELLLMHVRTRLIWKGIGKYNSDDDYDGRDGDHFNQTPQLEVSGGLRRHDWFAGGKLDDFLAKYQVKEQYGEPLVVVHHSRQPVDL